MNCKLQKDVSLEEIVYYIMFSLLLSLKGFGLDEGDILFRIGLVCAILLFGIKTLVGKYSIRELVIIALGGIWSIFIFFNMGSLSIVVYALIILGMKNISVPKVMKVGTVVWLICTGITITAGIFFDRVGVRVVHEKLGLGPLLRESLGYGHPNVLHITYIVLMAFVLYTCRKENIFKVISGLMAGNIFIFMYSMSYTGLLISIGLIVVYLYFVYRKNYTILEKILIHSVLPICLLFSIIVPYFLDSDSSIYRKVNSLLNNRLWIIKTFFEEYSLTLLGERIRMEGFSLDNSYIYALAWYGVIFFIILILGYFVLIKEYVKEERRKELAIIIMFLIAGLTEQFLFNASIKNITFVFMGEVLYKYIQQEEKEFKLASCYNKVYSINFEKILNMKGILRQLNYKEILIQYIIVNVLILLIVFKIPTNNYNHIYVNEKMCDCNAELFAIEQIEVTDDTLIIGNMTNENLYYYFSNDNSNFIMIMDTRYKLSLSIYLSLFIIFISILLKSKLRVRNY